MKTSRHKIASMLTDRSFDTNLDRQKFSRQIAAYLLENGRTGELGSLSRDIIQRRADAGIVEVNIVSAHKLSTEPKKAVKDKLRSIYPGAKRIVINEITDKEIIGGVRLEMANEQIDMSVRGKLNKLKQLTTIGKG